MQVHVYGINHIAIEVTDAQEAVKFYQELFGLELLSGGEGAAWCKVGEHQFMAIFEVPELRPASHRHFGLIVRDEAQVQEVRRRVEARGLPLHPRFRCDFDDPWGNRIQVVDLHDESMIWLLPYQEVQKLGITFAEERAPARPEPRT
jgi:catechol 2,3-dioxygenase-like lactoylglutathione lyase family enzyme